LFLWIRGNLPGFTTLGKLPCANNMTPGGASQYVLEDVLEDVVADVVEHVEERLGMPGIDRTLEPVLISWWDSFCNLAAHSPTFQWIPSLLDVLATGLSSAPR
jgi:hypothetical protein